MDGPDFDAWTRRRFGLATGSVLAALAGFGEMEVASKKNRKRKKKRCRKHLQTCKPGGKRKCCGKLRCDFHSGNSLQQEVCCKRSGQSCEKIFDCCFPLGCDEETRECRDLPPSDRAIKSNFGSVDPADMLERVRDLPISTWNYTSDDSSIRHIGPMAQDFTATFGVGADDRHIHPIDGQGVALAAIQGLLTQIEEMRQENAQLAARIAALEKGAQ
jgi:hypothetical protein